AAGDHDDARLELGAVSRAVRHEVADPRRDQPHLLRLRRSARDADLDRLVLARMEGAGRDVQADLRAMERAGGVGFDSVALYFAGGGVDAGGDVARDHRAAGGVDGRDGALDRLARLALEA